MWPYRFAGLGDLRSDLAKAVDSTLDDPPIPNGRSKYQIKPKTFHTEMNQDPFGAAVYKNVIFPVIDDLNLTPLEVTVTGKSKKSRDTAKRRCQQAAIILADITVPDDLASAQKLTPDLARVYYNVGGCDAYRDRGLILLIRKGQKPPFNLKERADLIEYEIDFDEALKAQGKLKRQILACLETTPPGDTLSPEIEIRQFEVFDIIQSHHQHGRDEIKAYVREKRAAVWRDQNDKKIRQQIANVGSKADQFHTRVESAPTMAEINQIVEELETEAPDWGNDAIKELLR